MIATQGQVAGLYIGLNLLLTLVLAMLVVRQRAKTGIGLGDGGNETLRAAIRAHGNNVEYIAIALPGLLALSLLGASTFVMHMAGILVTGGRAAHAVGITNSLTPARQLGTLATWLGILTLAIGCLYYALG